MKRGLLLAAWFQRPAIAYGMVLPLLAASHHIIAATAEMSLDPDSGKLEVALHLTPRDLEAALTRQAGQAVRLDRLDEDTLDAACRKLVTAHYRLLDPQPAALDYIGTELELTDAWLYFTLDAGGSYDGKTLKVTVLDGLHPEHVTTVTLGRGAAKRSLRFDQDTTSRVLQAKQTKGVGDDDEATRP